MPDDAVDSTLRMDADWRDEMMNRSKVVFVAVLVTLGFGMGACKSNSGSSDKQEAAAEKEASTESGESADEKPSAEPEPPSPDERLEALKEKESEEAREEITADNAEKVASELEKELEADLGEE